MAYILATAKAETGLSRAVMPLAFFNSQCMQIRLEVDFVYTCGDNSENWVYKN